MKALSVILVALSSPFAFAGAGADRCAFDFKAASKAIFEGGDVAKNFVTNPNFREKEDPSKATSWRRLNTYVSEKAITSGQVAEVRQKVEEMVEVSLDGGMASVKVPKAAVDLIGGRDVAWGLHAYLGKLVMLDCATGGPYRLTLRYRSNHDYGHENNYAYVFIQPVHVDDASGKGKTNVGKWICQDFRDTGEDSDYVNFWSKDFEVPDGANAIDFTIRFMGAGYLKFTDFQLTERTETEKARPDVEFLLKPYGMADNAFAIEWGQVGALQIAWNRSKAAKLDWWKSWLEVVVPKGFEFVGANMSDPSGRRKIERTKRQDGSERIRLPLGNRVQPYAEERFCDHNSIALLLRAKGPVGTVGTLAYRAIGPDGAPLRDIGSCTLRSVEPFTVVQPRRYRIGAMLTYALQLFRSGEGANEAYADYLRSKGVTWIMPQTPWLVEDKTLLPMWRAKGFDLITPTDHDYLMNAYNTRGTGERPKADAFVPKPGLDPKLGRAACPASIYEERPYFVTNIVPNLAARSAGTDGQWVNWEPYYFKGCYCDACRKAGAEWMAKTGDSNIEHFHSWQHGQLVKTIHRWMKKTFSPGTVGLMPAISWSEMSSQCRKDGYPQDKLSSDFADEIDWIPAWGPYVGWSPWEAAPYGGPYGIARGKSLLVFFAAKDVREETDRFFKPGKRPRLMGQPAGTNWLIQPEWLEISCDSYFFNRWEAIAPWIFPQGADARHWRAYANSVNRAAKYEDAVWDGERNDAATTLTAKPGFDIRCGVLDNFSFPGMTNVSLLQQTTYDHRGVRIVAVFNFDDECHSEFTLRTKGLSGDWLLVREDGVMPYGPRRFSAAELAGKGVGLSVSASRCTVFELHPASALDGDWAILGADKEGRRLAILDGAPGGTGGVCWSAPVESDPRISRAHAAAFNDIDEAKLSADGKSVYGCASSGAYFAIDLATAKPLFYGVYPAARYPDRKTYSNFHSIEELPDGRYAIAASVGVDALFLADPRGHEFEPEKQLFELQGPLPGGHGVLWDAKRNCLWALAYTNIVKCAYDSAAAKLTEVKRYDYVKAFNDPDATGHDFQRDGKGAFAFTTHATVRRFDPDTESFSIVAKEKDAKGFSPSARRGDLYTVADDLFWTNTARIRKDGAERKVGPVPGARFYKLRWLKPD